MCSKEPGEIAGTTKSVPCSLHRSETKMRLPSSEGGTIVSGTAATTKTLVGTKLMCHHLFRNIYCFLPYTSCGAYLNRIHNLVICRTLEYSFSGLVTVINTSPSRPGAAWDRSQRIASIALFAFEIALAVRVPVTVTFAFAWNGSVKMNPIYQSQKNNLHVSTPPHS